MKKTALFALVVPLLFGAWTLQPQGDLEKASWLLGTWENRMQQGTVYESWTKVSATEFSGKSYMLDGKDTVVFETIRLLREGEHVVYIPVVSDQNGGEPVRFTAKTVSDTLLVFENLQHDFPQVISYAKTGAGTLVAEISGTKNGKLRKQAFPMSRLK